MQGIAGRIVALEGVIREPRRDQAVKRPQPQHPLSPVSPRHPQPRAALAGDRRGRYNDYDRDNFEEKIGKNRRVPIACRYGRYGRKPDREFDEDERWAYRDRDHDIRNARIKAPSFDGSLEPQEYLDWEARMNRYFDWLGMRGACEEGALTLFRFWRGLRQTYQQELFRQHVTTLDHAYQVVREMEQFEQEWESSHVRSTYQCPLNLRTALGPTQKAPSN
ncbi:hypothetical protein Taro_025587 [Colocasia esculenta]|uniref:Retrotransposon gag domain-containing protein n=1 Tax=Colocasia esculenta TaxID=4460 RepID=A0A843V3Q8_COLES|nr:hypothetical protein [Colocasia esculenta]